MLFGQIDDPRLYRVKLSSKVNITSRAQKSYPVHSEIKTKQKKRKRKLFMNQSLGG